MIEVPQAVIDLAKRFEGFSRVPTSDPDRAYPYVCPAGFWTIGYGHLCDANHLPITMEEGEAYLAAEMADALRAALRYCPVLFTEAEGRLAAIVDFTFNLGAGRLQASTLRRRVNQRDWPVRHWSCIGGFTVAAECCQVWCSGARRKFRYFFEQLVVPFSADQNIVLRLGRGWHQ
jgi:lysozyme